MTGPCPTSIVSVIPAHLDSATVQWLAGLSTPALQGMRRHAEHELRNAQGHRTCRHALELRIQEIEFALAERGPLAPRLRAAAALDATKRRAVLDAEAALRNARLAYEAAALAHLHLQGLQHTTEDTHA